MDTNFLAELRAISSANIGRRDTFYQSTLQMTQQLQPLPQAPFVVAQGIMGADEGMSSLTANYNAQGNPADPASQLKTNNLFGNQGSSTGTSGYDGHSYSPYTY